MIFPSFLPGLGNLCIRIINSVVVVGLYYGFLTVFSIGPSSLFLLRARVIEEGTEEEISATTGFITGQLMMFISIYYAPLHLALGRPHTITVLVLPYLLFHLFWNNQRTLLHCWNNQRKRLDSGSTTTTRNSMRNLSIQCVFLNNLIFQLFNHFILPSSTLARLVNIYMFRCNNKILFLTSSFLGWLIGQILFIKWVEFLLFWIRKKYSIQSNKYLAVEFNNLIARIFSILLFITCLYYLGRTPLPIVTKKLKDSSETQEQIESEGDEENIESEGDNDVETTSENKMRETIQEQKGSTNYENSYLDIDQEPLELQNENEEEEKSLSWFEKPLVTSVFDYKRWNRPLRYLKNDLFENAVRNEMSQYFFNSCPSDGKQRISFTYPPSLSAFLEMIQKKLDTTEKVSHENKNGYTNWVDANEQKKANLNWELRNRINVLETQKGSRVPDVLEKRIRLYNDEKKEGYLPTKYDPLLSEGASRWNLKQLSSCRVRRGSIMPPAASIEENVIWLNKIHNLLHNNSREVEDKKNVFLDSVHEESSVKFDSNDETIDETIRNQLEDINKIVPRWSYKLTDELEEQAQEDNQEEPTDDNQIRSRKGKRVVIFTDKDPDTDPSNNSDPEEQVSLMRYSQQSDFSRDLIKGSMRAQRRKTVISEMFQANVHSPLFLDQIPFLFSFDFSEMMNLFSGNWMRGESETLISDSEETKEKNKKNGEKEDNNIAISEAWDTILFAQAIRGLLLLTQSFFRKYIKLPFLIIAKNIGRMLLYESPEWNEDWRDWNREIHIKCTYNGVQLSETEFPKNWLMDGIQIKILFPFRLKPWQGSKIRSHHRDQKEELENFSFLTIWGTEVEAPFGSQREQPSFFKPIFKEFKKKYIKVKKKNFLVLKVLKKKQKWFIRTFKEKTKWIQKIVLVIKGIIKELQKRNPILLLELNKNELVENEKNSIISSNKNNQELIIPIQSINWKNYSLMENKMKDLIDRTITIKNEIEQIKKEKNKIIEIPDRNIISPNKRNLYDKISKLWKHIWLIVKRRKSRLIRKLHYFIKSFVERIYTDIFVYSINIFRLNVQFFIKSIEKTMEKSTSSNKTNQEGTDIDEPNKNMIPFILTIKKYLLNISSKNLNPYCDLSSLSQAYVFYKISQTQASNKYHLRSVLQYHETHLFLKNKIKNYCETQGLFDSKSKVNKSRINKWKSWLKSHYQYNLSQTKWSRLVSKKWRNEVNRRCIIENENSMKLNSYKEEKDPLISYVKPKYYRTNLLMDEKEKFKRNCRYDLLLHKYINYENSENSYISELPFQVNTDRKILYSYNFNTQKPQSPYVLMDIDLSDYLGEEYYIYKKKIWRKNISIVKFSIFFIRQNINIDTWANMHIGTKLNKNTKTRMNTYQKLYNNNILSLTIHQEIKPSNSNQKRNFFDWMGMNKEKLYGDISNRKPEFFPEFGILYDTYNAYKIKPWIIPIKLLLNFDANENASQNKNINENTKKDLYISSDQKKYFELEFKNQEKKQQPSQVNLEFDVQERKKKDMEEGYMGSSNIKNKEGRKKEYKSKKEAELDLFLKKYLLFQLRWDDPLNERMINNIKVYCLLLRLVNPKEITISSIERGEMSLDIMVIQKDLALTELIKNGILIIEPLRPSIKWDAKFIMYQIIGISLVNKNKYQIDGKCINKKSNDYDFLIPEQILSTRHRRKLRILMCFDSRNKNGVNEILPFGNENNGKNCKQFMNEGEDQYIHTNKLKLMKFKFFIWPNYRLEDLACMNRYCFNTNNGSRFTMSRIHMYPQF
uniref:Protein TIC 214 n=1 Tax=Elodea canadensis TaxID=100364 RepID=J7F459_ELOCA|nr:hypothetical chloroplast RF19 [Elodea canadensis]AEY84711.1 hypothetical chloroplast RF19 [Elodea canadensis]